MFSVSGRGAHQQDRCPAHLRHVQHGPRACKTSRRVTPRPRSSPSARRQARASTGGRPGSAGAWQPWKARCVSAHRCFSRMGRAGSRGPPVALRSIATPSPHPSPVRERNEHDSERPPASPLPSPTSARSFVPPFARAPAREDRRALPSSHQPHARQGQTFLPTSTGRSRASRTDEMADVPLEAQGPPSPTTFEEVRRGDGGFRRRCFSRFSTRLSEIGPFGVQLGEPHAHQAVG